MLLRMARVQIIGTKQHQDQAIELLHRIGLVQIDHWQEAKALAYRRMGLDDATLDWRERLAYLITRVEAGLAGLPPLLGPAVSEYEAHGADPIERLIENVERELAEIAPQIQQLTTEAEQLEAQLASLPRYEATLKQLLPLVPALVDLDHYAVTAVLIEKRYQEIIQHLIRQLDKITAGQYEVISRETDRDTLAAIIVFPKEQAGAVNELLGRENIALVRLPGELAGQPFEQALIHIRRQLKTIPEELNHIAAQKADLARRWRPRLLVWQALLRDHLDRIEVRTNFGQTDYTFIIEGWIPKERVPDLTTRMAHEVSDEVIVTELPLAPTDEANAPVIFNNPAFVRPFEPLVGLLALPRYGGFDPTPLMSIFLPIFFGLILGDIGYGAILLLLMLYLRRRFRQRATLRSLAEVLLIGSVWSLLFGVLFGEFFGDLGETLGLHPLWFDRSRNVPALFLLTIGIGAGHIVLGLGLGVWTALRQRDRPALIEKIATLISLAALFLLVAVLADYLPSSFLTPSVALLVVGLAILIYSLGSLGFLLGPLELLSTIGNILSYLRIAAIGLSSVYLAQVANELAGSLGNVLVGLIVASLFHALNIALGAFSPTIQSLRLHYVEFFSKFYQGGGEPFHPFRRSLREGDHLS